MSSPSFLDLLSEHAFKFWSLGATIAVALILAFCLRGAAHAQSEWAYPPVPCATPCIIEFSPGGIMDLFAAQGRELAAEHRPVVVDGPCLSACTILVDLARDSVCITKNAVLGYHKGIHGETTEDVSYQTPGLNAYIEAHGGLPDPDSGHLLMLNFNEARAFYRACPGA